MDIVVNKWVKKLYHFTVMQHLCRITISKVKDNIQFYITTLIQYKHIARPICVTFSMCIVACVRVSINVYGNPHHIDYHFGPVVSPACYTTEEISSSSSDNVRPQQSYDTPGSRTTLNRPGIQAVSLQPETLAAEHVQ